MPDADDNYDHSLDDSFDALMKRNNEVLSKEGKPVGHVGNAEVDPFRERLAALEAEASEATLKTAPREVRAMADSIPPQRDGEPGLKMRDGDQDLPRVNEATDCQTTFLKRITADVDIRRDIGIQRYGTALQPFNGRDVVRDAWEEFIDLGQYLEQWRRERHELIETIRRVVQAHNADNAYLRGAYIDMLSEMLEEMGYDL